ASKEARQLLAQSGHHKSAERLLMTQCRHERLRIAAGKPTLNPISPIANPWCNYDPFGVAPPWAGNATTRFHQSNCWISHCMADRRSRAADQKVANRRFYGRGHVSDLQ